MKAWFTVLLLVLPAAVAAGGDDHPVPQPRVRLDPVKLAAVADPPKDPRNDSGSGAIMMEKYVVRDTGLLFLQRRTLADPKGKFTPTGGGRLWQRDTGPFRVEFGAWPSVDIFSEEALFKPQPTQASWDILRIKW